MISCCRQSGRVRTSRRTCHRGRKDLASDIPYPSSPLQRIRAPAAPSRDLAGAEADDGVRNRVVTIDLAHKRLRERDEALRQSQDPLRGSCRSRGSGDCRLGASLQARNPFGHLIDDFDSGDIESHRDLPCCNGRTARQLAARDQGMQTASRNFYGERLIEYPGDPFPRGCGLPIHVVAMPSLVSV